MIDEGLAAFIEGPVMIILAVATPLDRPTIGRAVGARFDAGRQSITILVSRRQWPVLAGSIVPETQIAVTFCRASDYTTYQVKGRVSAVREPGAGEHALAAHYVQTTSQTLGALGVGQGMIDQWVPTDDIIRLDFTPASVFVQTPGPSAGQALGGRP